MIPGLDIDRHRKKKVDALDNWFDDIRPICFWPNTTHSNVLIKLMFLTQASLIEQHLNLDYSFDHQMSPSNSKCWHSNNLLEQY